MFNRQNISIRGDPSRIGLTVNLNCGYLYKCAGNNPGNFLYIYAISNYFKFPKHKDWTHPIDEEEKVLIYPLANQLGKHYNPEGLTRFWNNLPSDIKIVGIGLGAQAPLNLDFLSFINELSEVYKQFVKAIIDRAVTDFPNLIVRGEFTYRVLEALGFGDKVIIGGCPSFLLSPIPNLGMLIKKRYDMIDKSDPVIHFALGAPWVSQYNKFEKKGIRLAIRTGGRIHVQMNNLYAKYARLDDLSKEEIDRITRELGFNEDDLYNISKRHFSIWWDVPSWLEFLYQNADFVFGARIHGIIAALLSGVPALCVVIDSRTKELCEFMKIPYVEIFNEPWKSGSYNWEDLRHEFERQFDYIEFDKNRIKIALLYEEFFKKNFLPANISLIEQLYNNPELMQYYA